MKAAAAALLILAAMSAQADTLVANYDGRKYSYTGTLTELTTAGLGGVAYFTIATRVVVPDTSPAPPIAGEWTIILSSGKIYDGLECYPSFDLSTRALNLWCADDDERGTK